MSIILLVLLLPSVTFTISYLATIKRYLIVRNTTHHKTVLSRWQPLVHLQAFQTYRRHLVHVYKRATASRANDLLNLKSITHKYHKLVTAAKKQYYSSYIYSSSSNPRHLWRAVNSLFHRNLPFHCPAPFFPPLSLIHSSRCTDVSSPDDSSQDNSSPYRQKWYFTVY